MKYLQQLRVSEVERAQELLKELQKLLTKNRGIKLGYQLLNTLMREQCLLTDSPPTESTYQFANSSTATRSLRVSVIAFDLDKMEALAIKERGIFNNNVTTTANSVASQMTLGFINTNSPTDEELEAILDKTLDMFQLTR